MVVTDKGLAVLNGTDQLSHYVLTSGLECDGMMRQHILPILHPGDWVVDGGAALGDHTACYIQRVAPNGVVFAFEPHPEFYKCLRHNAPTAVAIPCALGQDMADVNLNETPGNVGSSYLTKERTSEDVWFETRTLPLDALGLTRCDFVKLDVEGMEYSALLGMTRTIERCRPKLAIEIRAKNLQRFNHNHHDIFSFLSRNRYVFNSICGSSDPATGECDILATPN